MHTPLVLLTGATGYVGGRLLKALEGEGRRVRCLARRPDALRPIVARETCVVAGDLLDPSSLGAALRGVDAAYYLVHSMASSGSFEEEDRRTARTFAQEAAAAGLRRIIYLGGLAPPEGGLSPHLRSRLEVGDLLRSSGVQVVEFRASIVVGAGSLSFEMVRALVERLPVMVTPRWVSVPAQPIAVGDLLAYLLAALDLPLSGNPIFEIGGADVVSYGGIMREYARQRGLRRLVVRVPVLTPYLSSLWLALVTPLYARVGRQLIESIRHPTVVRDGAATRVFAIRPQTTRDAIAAALRDEDAALARQRWPAEGAPPNRPPPWGGVPFGGMVVESWLAPVAATPPAAFRAILRLGGKNGWYYGNRLWRLRGLIDRLCGGPGMRGRLDPDTLRVGDPLDWWRVEAIEDNRHIRLAAEMKLPGRAWLQFDVEAADGGSVITQTAIFDPLGLSGRLYWHLLYPVHRLIFAGLLRGIVATCAPGSVPG